MVGLLKYFKLKWRNEGKSKGLPNPNGELSKVVPSSSIEITNGVVNEVSEKERRPRGPYISVTPAQKYTIGQRAAENEIAEMLHYYAKKFPDLPLKETIVRRFKKNYQENPQNNAYFHLLCTKSILHGI